MSNRRGVFRLAVLLGFVCITAQGAFAYSIKKNPQPTCAPITVSKDTWPCMEPEVLTCAAAISCCNRKLEAVKSYCESVEKQDWVCYLSDVINGYDMAAMCEKLMTEADAYCQSALEIACQAEG